VNSDRRVRFAPRLVEPRNNGRRELELRNVKISAFGCYVPPGVLTNQDLEKMVDTSDEWILSRTGIHERHIAAPEMATSDMAVEAAKLALAQRPSGVNGMIRYDSSGTPAIEAYINGAWEALVTAIDFEEAMNDLHADQHAAAKDRSRSPFRRDARSASWSMPT